MYYFNIVLTELCNAKCSHCYMADSKEKKTLKELELDTIIDKIPKNTKSIVLTGGEVTLVKDLLESTIKKIKKKNKNIEIGVESNGILFYKDLEKGYNELKRLKDLGVNSIRFSLDSFHAIGGVDLEKVKKLKELEDKNTPIIKFLVQEKALPLGRGKEIKEEEISKPNCMNKESTKENPYLFMDINGELYPCAWKTVPSIGNLLKDDWNTIEKNLKEENMEWILTGKIEKAISNITNTKEEELLKESKKNGQCYLCMKTFCKGGSINE